MTSPSRAVLGVFAKWPTPGAVKTRLAAETTPAWAASVAAAFLGDTLDRLAGVKARRLIAYAPESASDAFTELAAGRYDLWHQGTGDLGERLTRFFLANGDAGAVVVGSDSPTLPAEVVERAFADLARADVVLGPATDGGYYLLGCRKPIPELFAGITWGGSRVLGQTAARVSDVGLSLSLLPPWYDVDSLADWHMLAGHVAAMRHAGIDPGAPRTEGLLRLPAA
jgi:rSAM/selenodomain-associated transferase 1